MNQANGTLAGREPESDTSGDDDAVSLPQTKRLGQDGESQMLTVVSEGTRDASPRSGGQTLAQHSERQPGNLFETVLCPSEERDNSIFGLRDIDPIDPYIVNGPPSKDPPAIEPDTPQHRLVEKRRTNAFAGHSPSSAATSLEEREMPRLDCINRTSIDPAVLSTPQNKIGPLAATASTSSDRSYRTRLSIRRDCSVSPSPRRRRIGVWRTYEAKGGNS